MSYVAYVVLKPILGEIMHLFIYSFIKSKSTKRDKALPYFMNILFKNQMLSSKTIRLRVAENLQSLITLPFKV